MKYIERLKIKNNQLSIINDDIEINKLELSDNISKELVLKYKKIFMISNNFLSFLVVKYLDILSDNEKKMIMKKITSNPKLSYKHAVLIRKRFTDGEKIILTDPLICSLYVEDVIRDRWKEAESIIASNGLAAFRYSINGLKGSWYDFKDIDLKIRQQAENNIIKDCDVNDLIRYSLNANKRWIEMKNIDKKISLKIEDKIFREGDGINVFNYIEDFIRNRVKEAELEISKNPESAYDYARKYLQKPWHKIKDIDPIIIQTAEDSLLNLQSLQDNISINYAKYLIRGRWKKLEDILITNRNNNFYFDIIDNYYQEIIGDDSWPEMDRYADEEYEEVI
jgi:hypothetical protein